MIRSIDPTISIRKSSTQMCLPAVSTIESSASQEYIPVSHKMKFSSENDATNWFSYMRKYEPVSVVGKYTYIVLSHPPMRLACNLLKLRCLIWHCSHVRISLYLFENAGEALT